MRAPRRLGAPRGGESIERKGHADAKPANFRVVPDRHDDKGRMTKTVQVGFRLPTDLVKRIDAYAARIANENPGLEVTRALAVKALLTQALDAIEATPKHRGK
jgi:hypothetical protein